MEAVATKKTIKLKVNGKEHTLEVSANETLLEVLREIKINRRQDWV